LYGRNATGGAVNLIPAKPELGKSYADVGLDVGNYNTLRLSAAANESLNDISALRFSFRTSRNDGYWSENAGASDSQAARLQFRLEPNDGLSLLLGSDYYHNGGTATNGVVDQGTTVLQVPVVEGPTGPRFVQTLTLPTAGFPNSQGISLSDPRLVPTFLAQGLTPPAPGSDNNKNTIYGVNATLGWTNDLGTLTVIPAYRHAKLEFLSYGAGFGLGVDERDDQESMEARFASNNAGSLSWIVGGFYLHDHVESHMDIDTFAPAFLGTSVDNHFTIDTKSWAPFADATFKITDAVRLIGGIRYSVDRKQPEGSLSTTRPPPNSFDCLASDPNCISLSGTPVKQWSSTTYRGGVEWDVTAASMAYATYATGWHSGGFFFTHDDPVYQPEQLGAYTIGSKNRFLDNRLQANVELFYWKYRNQQTSFVAVDSQGTADFVTKNVGRSTRKGVDADLRFRVTNDTTVGLQAQYLEAEYQEFNYLVSSAFPVNTGCNVSFADAAHLLVNCANAIVPYSPRWTVNVPLEQTFHLATGASLNGVLRMHYQSEESTGTQNVPIELQDRYATLDASIGYRNPAGTFGITLYGENLTNRVIKSQTFQSTASGILGAQQAIYFETLKSPLTFGLRLDSHFGG
jgi:iron complex outermembrane receptor protein